MSFSLAPGLLIAMPTLADPNFARAVVLMCSHTREGAFGLLLNRQLDLPVRAICAEAKIPWRGDASIKALSGGPVEPMRGWLLHSSETRFEVTHVVDEGVALSSSLDALTAFGAAPSARFRFLLGHAGWGPGQLDRELSEGTWLTAPLTPELVLDTPRSELWQRALASVGADLAHLSAGSTTVH